MNFDFSIIKNPYTTSPVALRTVYVIHADPSYDVRKGGIPNSDLIALRTIGGTGNIKIDGLEEITLHPQTLLFFKHADIRRYYCSSETWDFWWFEFSTGGMLDIPQNTILTIEPAQNEMFDCRSCLELLHKDNPCSNSLASATLSLLLYKWMFNFENKTKANPYHVTVQKAIDLFSANINNRVSVKEMADCTGLCERRFRQVFMNLTGVQPKKYMESLRISMSEELLRSTPFSIKEISERLGYSSQFHFCKAFQKTHVLSPSQYRRESFGNQS